MSLNQLYLWWFIDCNSLTRLHKQVQRWMLWMWHQFFTFASLCFTRVKQFVKYCDIHTVHTAPLCCITSLHLKPSHSLNEAAVFRRTRINPPTSPSVPLLVGSMGFSFPPRHSSAHERKQTHHRLSQGPLLQGVDVLWRPAAAASGDRAADGEDPGRYLGAPARGGEAGRSHRRGKVGGAAAVGVMEDRRRQRSQILWCICWKYWFLEVFTARLYRIPLSMSIWPIKLNY